MIIAKVLGPVVATIKHKSFVGRRIFAMEPVDDTGRKAGTQFLAFDDDIRPGPGDTVLVCREGSGCRQIWKDTTAPVNSVIVGVIDHLIKQ
ncbi:MAG: EutN/CcmL family microcompartment protein [Bdellovibrionia bacterium]